MATIEPGTDKAASQVLAGFPLIAICIPTFRRPKGLARVLESLQSLEVDRFRPHLIIADNDSELSGQSVTTDFAERMPFPVTYVMEPERGIASARNSLVTEANKLEAEYIAFTDDDVIVEPDWIKQSLDRALSTKAAAIVGQQLYVFEEGVPQHIQIGVRPTPLRSGEPSLPFSTANLLVKTAALSRIEGPFDKRFNLSGGSDAMLDAQLRLQGFTIERARDSIVYEIVPVSRANTRWILKRGFRNGLNRTRIRLYTASSARDIAEYIAKTVAFSGLCMLQFLKVLAFQRDNRVLGIKSLAVMTGRLYGLISPKAVYKEYKTIHGE